ncbi:MAG: NlpC/P60 family protein, partial [Geobacteraceae bacterium]|nr:NlpC/P60 family protein [Geobacteraceae bacterium]
EQLIAEICSWEKTRWVHGQAVKGVGTDCVQFPVAVAKWAGWLPAGFKTVPYDVDYALHNEESILVRELKKYCNQVPLDQVRPGDLLAFFFGKCESHAGFYIGNGQVMHAHIRHGVVRTELRSIRSKLKSAWRFRG